MEKVIQRTVHFVVKTFLYVTLLLKCVQFVFLFIIYATHMTIQITVQIERGHSYTQAYKDKRECVCLCFSWF